MKHVDVKNLSDKAVKLLLSDCETKIKHCQADLDDYELFVKCQRELLKRQASKEISNKYSSLSFSFF